MTLLGIALIVSWSNKGVFMRTAKYVVIIVISILIIIFLANRNRFFGIVTEKNPKITIGLISAILGVACIFAIIYSLYGIINSKVEQVNNQIVHPDDVTFTVDEIVNLAEQCDVIDVYATHNNKVLRLGTSSDSMPGKTALFNKKYYIGDICYSDVDSFREALFIIFPDNVIHVASIDDVDPFQYK